MNYKLRENVIECLSGTSETSQVVALMDSEEYEQFVAVNMANYDFGFELPLVDVDEVASDFIGILKEFNPEILITAWRTPYLPEDLPQQLPSLQYIAHCCGTVQPILPRFLIEKGLLVTNWGPTAARDVAEHCLMQTLASLRKVSKFQQQMHFKGKWRDEEVSVSSLFNKKVGIYGTGNSAQQYAKLLKAFDCEISMYSLGIPEDLDPCIYVARDIKEIFADNDVVVVLEAANKDTYGSVDKQLLSLIKPGGIFVNSARGIIVNQEDLTDIALKGEILIALDVYEPEPLDKNSLLRGCENVLLTPHVAGPTKDNRALCGLYCLRNVENYLLGKPVKSIITTDDYDRMSPN